MKCQPLMDIINQINDEKIRLFVQTVLNSLPDEFYLMRTSITGKYHPPECNEVGGIIVHIQRACYFGKLFIDSCKWDRNDIRGDLLIAAILLHDIGKKEKYNNGWEYPNHPIEGMKFASHFKNLITEAQYNCISGCILHHMGIFGPKSILKPLNKYNMLELYTYQADFLASKKELKIVI